MITIFKRGPVWWVAAALDGKRRRWSLGTGDEVVAKRLAGRAELEGLVRELEPKLGPILRRGEKVEIYQRGRIWHAALGGRRLSLHTPNREIATETLQILARATRTVQIAWVPFADEFERHACGSLSPSTSRQYAFVLGRFGQFLKSSGVAWVDEINPAHIKSYAEQRLGDFHPTRKTAVSAGSVKADLRVLHRVFAYALERYYVAFNPVGETEGTSAAMPILVVRGVSGRPPKTKGKDKRKRDYRATESHRVGERTEGRILRARAISAAFAGLPKRARYNAARAVKLLSPQGFSEREIDAATHAPGDPLRMARWMEALETGYEYDTVAQYHKEFRSFISRVPES